MISHGDFTKNAVTTVTTVTGGTDYRIGEEKNGDDGAVTVDTPPPPFNFLAELEWIELPEWLPSTPEEARTEAIERAGNGETIAVIIMVMP
ncbi:MAG: hypothetical protein HC884_00940 [Chloroflexaceae bacterium]|nr:hypothetical protein [Chloroflexaceae bacterium]